MNWVQLDNGEHLLDHKGKYNTGLVFLSLANLEKLPWTNRDCNQFNLPYGDISTIRGNYWKSKKGSNCFRIDNNGKHLLIRDSWGGAFNSYRGNTLPKENSIYYNRATSNGGGVGYDYAVYEENWRYSISINDI